MMKKILLILLILLVAAPSAFSLDFREAKKMSKKQEKEVLYKIVSMSSSVSSEKKIFCITFFDNVIQIKMINVITGDTILYTGAKIKARIYISVDIIEETGEKKTIKSTKTEHFRLFKNGKGWKSLGESSPTVWGYKNSEEKTQED